ncbi:DUF1016 N-terminal domain-containing protein [Pedobacter sp. PACM 27299]|uniref:DUF1016 N-terminal domain-containing protein n=1 Tax=Pedobacter sp. PACM 27299 TaxID=1727164 RepID=UPI000ADFDBB4|nr:DUF1016 N-terminal domain-containing protein [Pedobacter sp. PACM 27299]
MIKEINAQLFSSINELIELSKQQIAISVNSTMTMLYWQIGKIINDELLQHKRAEYGKQIVATLSRQLQVEYGSSFSEKNIRRMLQFRIVFPENEIVATLSRQLSWSHIKELIPIDELLKRILHSNMHSRKLECTCF